MSPSKKTLETKKKAELIELAKKGGYTGYSKLDKSGLVSLLLKKAEPKATKAKKTETKKAPAKAKAPSKAKGKAKGKGKGKSSPKEKVSSGSKGKEWVLTAVADTHYLGNVNTHLDISYHASKSDAVAQIAEEVRKSNLRSGPYKSVTDEDDFASLKKYFAGTKKTFWVKEDTYAWPYWSVFDIRKIPN